MIVMGSLGSLDLQRFKEVKYGKFVRVDLFPSNALPFPGAGPYPASSRSRLVKHADS